MKAAIILLIGTVITTTTALSHLSFTFFNPDFLGATSVSNFGGMYIRTQFTPVVVEICDNGIDDNGDGLIDREDAFSCP
jgi:hypothetical protein